MEALFQWREKQCGSFSLETQIEFFDVITFVFVYKNLLYIGNIQHVQKEKCRKETRCCKGNRGYLNTINCKFKECGLITKHSQIDYDKENKQIFQPSKEVSRSNSWA